MSRTFPSAQVSPRRDSLIDALMRPGIVELRGVRREHTMQLSFVHNDHLVEALLPA